MSQVLNSATSKTATNASYLVKDLHRLATSYENEAKRLREFASKIEGTPWDQLVGSGLGQEVQGLVMDSFNTSGRVSSAHSAMMHAARVDQGV